MSYLDKYTILESFHKNPIQNLQMGYIKSDPNHIVVINVMNASDMFPIEDFQHYVTGFTSIVESEINENQCILITDYHEGHPLEKFLDNFQPPLNLRLRIAHQFFELLRGYHALPFFILDKLLDAKHFIVKDNHLTHNELLMYDANYTAPQAFDTLSVKIGRILTLIVPDVSDRHAQSFYTIIDDLLHGSRFSSLDSLLQTYDQIAGRYKTEIEPQPPIATAPKDVWKVFDTPITEIAGVAAGTAVVLGHNASFTESLKDDPQPNSPEISVPTPYELQPDFDTPIDTPIDTPSIIDTAHLTGTAPDAVADTDTDTDTDSDPILIPLVMPELEPLATRDNQALEDPEFENPQDLNQISDFWSTPGESIPSSSPSSETLDTTATEDAITIDGPSLSEVLTTDPTLDIEDNDPFKTIHLQIDDRIKLEENRKKKMWMVLLPILLLLLVIIGLVLVKPFSFKSYQEPRAQFTQTKTGTTWHFTSTSTSDPNLSLKTFQWTLSKEGITVLTKTDKDISYTFTEKGTYDISLKVMDSKLKWSAPFKISLVIDPISLADSTEATSEVATDNTTTSGEVLEPGVEEDATTARSGASSYKVTLADSTDSTAQVTLTDMNFEGNGVLSLWIKTAEQGKITLNVTGLMDNAPQFTTTIETDNYPIDQWFLMTQNIDTKAVDTLLIKVSGTAKVLWLDDITLETIK